MVPCSLNGSLAVFVPQETQCQGELTNPIKVRESVGCIPEEIWSIHWAEKRGHRWRRLFHPILLHCAFLSLIRTNRFMCTASSVKPLRACYLRAPTPCSYFSCWWGSSILWLRTWTQTAWVQSLALPLPDDLGQVAKASAAASVQWGQGHWQPQEVFSENFRRYILCHKQFVLCLLILLCLCF